MGVFITFEGPEGSGKSSACVAVKAAFDEEMLMVREPGTTKLGEKIRTLLFHEAMPARSELFLFEAARACFVDTVVKPALAAGKNIMCDRFYDSSTAYQGYGRRLDLLDVMSMNNVAADNVHPDLTIICDVDPEVGMRRKGGSTDRIEAAGMEFHRRVRNGYLSIAKKNPQRCVVVDASVSMADVQEIVFAIIEQRFGWKRR